MNFAIPNESFFALNRGKYLSEMFVLPKNAATVYVSTHLELGESDLLHYHEEPHLTFILNGGVIDKRKNIDLEKSSGGLMVFHAGEPHQTISKTFPTKYFSLQFQSDLYRQNPGLEKALTFSPENILNAKLSILKIYRELTISDEFSESSLEMLLFGLINDKKSVAKFRPDWINKVSEILHDRWNEEITVQELASAVQVHPKTISKYFPKYFACTLGEYRRKIKVEKAISLIKSSNLSLTEIAYECGFYDQSHFTGIFKQLTGLRPRQFQKL